MIFFNIDVIEENIKVQKCPDPNATLSFNIYARILKNIVYDNNEKLHIS